MNKLLKRFWECSPTGRQPGSSRTKTALTAEKIEAVNDWILSHDGAPQTHRTTLPDLQKNGSTQIICQPHCTKVLGLKCLKKRPTCARTECCKSEYASRSITSVAAKISSYRSGLHILHRRKGLHGRATRQPTEWLRLCTDWYKETWDCRWTPPAYATDLQQVRHGLCDCLQVGLYGSRVRRVRCQSERSVLPGRTSVSRTSASHPSYHRRYVRL